MMKPHIKKVYCDNMDDWTWFCQHKGTYPFGFGFTPAQAYEIWSYSRQAYVNLGLEQVVR